MATGRMLQRKISKNETLPLVIQRLDEQLGPPHGAYAALLFTWCIAHQDVEGRLEGDPRVVRAQVFTMLEWVSSADVERYLVELARVGLIVWYEALGRKWIYFPSFADSQPGLRRDRESASTIPAPETGRPLVAGVTPELLRSDAGVTPPLKLEVRSKNTEKSPTASASPSPGPVAESADLGNAVTAAKPTRKPLAPELSAFDAGSRSAASKAVPSSSQVGNAVAAAQSTRKPSTPEPSALDATVRSEACESASGSSQHSDVPSRAPPNNHDQQHLSFEPSARPKKARTAGPSRAEIFPVLERYSARWVATRVPADGQPPTCKQADYAQLRALVARFGADEAARLVDRYLDDPDPWLARQGHPLRLLPSRVDGYRARAGPRADGRRGPVPVAKGLDFKTRSGATS